MGTSTPASLSRCRIAAFGGPERIFIERDLPLPEPGPGEARIAIEASSVQFTDTVIRRGRYPGAGRPPLTLGYDLVGHVDALGPGVSGLALGARVADLCVTGGNASHALRPAAGLVPVPAELDAAMGAALVLSGVTAYQMIIRHARVRPGEHVLIQGGAGAVGSLAVQIALRAGAHVIASARTAHHAALAALGAEPVDYADPDYPARVRDLTSGGADVVFDGYGADGFRASRRCLRRGGRLVFIGTSEAVNRGRSMIWAGTKLLLRNAWPVGPRSSLFSVSALRARQPAWFREDLAALFGLLAAGELRVRVARRIGFDRIAEAHAALERGGLAGKIVLLPVG